MVVTKAPPAPPKARPDRHSRRRQRRGLETSARSEPAAGAPEESPAGQCFGHAHVAFMGKVQSDL